VLGEFVRGKLGLDATAGSWEMIREIGRRNAKMVAAWQAYVRGCSRFTGPS
jgi:uncharacterized protein YdiU (UPF0061 family)